MILRPVRPQSPTGPPITKRPVGLMWYLVRLLSQRAGSTGLMISSITASRRSFWPDFRRVLGREHDGLDADRLWSS